MMNEDRPLRIKNLTQQKRFDPEAHYAMAVIHHAAANTEHVKRKFLDVPYAHLSSSQKLDIYLPDEGDGPFPVILSIHGGAFMGCDKTDDQVMPMLEGLKRGYAVVAVNYRLSWEAIFPALVHDVKAAVRWVRANAHKYHLDPERIAAWGCSAGGFLSSMLGVSADISDLEDLSLGNPDQSSYIHAVIDWYGPKNFLKMDEQLEANGRLPPVGFRHSEANSPESLLLGQAVTEIPEKVKEANPEIYIRPNTPPFLIQHGNKDLTVPVQQSVEFAEKLKRVLGEKVVTLELVEGAEHEDAKFQTPQNVARVLDFLDEHLKND
jgi:acetyl esterase/lipase